MSTRWMAVQYVGDTLRIPVANESDMDKPFGSSRLERDIKRIVVNPFSDSPQTFVPEAENAKLRQERNHWHVEQVHAYGNWEDAYKRAIELEKQNAKLRELVRELYEDQCDECDRWKYIDRMRELGIEVDDG